MDLSKIVSFAIEEPNIRQVRVELHLNSRSFILSAPVFPIKREIPLVVRKYLSTVANKTFEPFETWYASNRREIFLIQKIGYEAYEKGELGEEKKRFLQLARSCRKMLSEMALEEKYSRVWNSSP